VDIIFGESPWSEWRILQKSEKKSTPVMVKARELVGGTLCDKVTLQFIYLIKGDRQKCFLSNGGS